MGIVFVASLAAWVGLLAREDQVDTGSGQRHSGRGHGRQLAFGEADVERHVAAVLEAELLEPGLEALHGRMGRGPRCVEDADPERAWSLLCLRGGGEDAKQRCRGQAEEVRAYPHRATYRW
jgi:hypothetical protein